MPHQIVIIGAGYAGLPAAKRLARQVRPDEVTVRLVSAFPDFVERPRLHQLAVGQDIESIPLTRYLRGSGVELLVASVTGIDRARREVHTTDGRGRQRAVRYDTLVYALGSTIDVASVPGVAEHCATLIGAASALDLRARLTSLAGEGATVAVCGGGLTGIEAAAEIATTFPSLRTQIVSARTPGGWLSEKGRRYLDETFDRLGIAVVDRARVDHVESDHLVLADRRHVPFDLCVWAGGFTVPTLAWNAGLAVNADGRALVDSSLRSVSDENVYVIGDAAAIAGDWGDQLAMGCRTGGYTGLPLADIVAAGLTGRAAKPFRYRYIHECISLGRKHGLVQFLNRDQTPKDRILTGRKAITYKNMTLNGAKLLFRHSGPILARRRPITATGRTPQQQGARATVREPAEGPSMTTDRVRLEIRNGIAYVILSRAEKYNGLDRPMLHGLVAVAGRIAADRSVRVVILAGAGPAFCTGLDFASVGKSTGALIRTGLKLPGQTTNLFQRACWAWRELPVPVIAVLHGHCLGGGLQLALAADFRFATPDCELSIMEGKWGLIPDMTGSVTLRELVPMDVAKRLTMAAEIFDGRQALGYGLVTGVADEPLKEAEALADQLVARSPDALALTKRLLHRTWTQSPRRAFWTETVLQIRLLCGANHRIARAANRAREAPSYVRRRM